MNSSPANSKPWHCKHNTQLQRREEMGEGCGSRSKIWLSGWEIDFSLIWERTSSQYALKIEQAVLGNCDFPNTWGIQVWCGGLTLERMSIMWEVLSNQLWNAFEIEFLRLYNIYSSAWRWQNLSLSLSL